MPAVETASSTLFAIALDGRDVWLRSEVKPLLAGLPEKELIDVLLGMRELGYSLRVPSKDRGRQAELSRGARAYFGAGTSCGLFVQHLPIIRYSLGLL